MPSSSNGESLLFKTRIIGKSHWVVSLHLGRSLAALPSVLPNACVSDAGQTIFVKIEVSFWQFLGCSADAFFLAGTCVRAIPTKDPGLCEKKSSVGAETHQKIANLTCFSDSSERVEELRTPSRRLTVEVPLLVGSDTTVFIILLPLTFWLPPIFAVACGCVSFGRYHYPLQQMEGGVPLPPGIPGLGGSTDPLEAVLGPFPCARLRNLPYDVSLEDILGLFQGLVVIDVVIGGGEAFVIFANPMDYQMGLQR